MLSMQRMRVWSFANEWRLKIDWEFVALWFFCATFSSEVTSDNEIWDLLLLIDGRVRIAEVRRLELFRKFSGWDARQSLFHGVHDTLHHGQLAAHKINDDDRLWWKFFLCTMHLCMWPLPSDALNEWHLHLNVAYKFDDMCVIAKRLF